MPDTRTPIDTPTRLYGLFRLTRWKEHVPFALPLTILGALLAARNHGAALDWRLVAVIFGNLLAVTYAFMLNDLEDAPDDARDAQRGRRNPVVTGEIDAPAGYRFAGLAAALALVCYLLAGVPALIPGALTLVLAHLYSWRRVRLKGWPLIDISAHALMLSGLLLLAGFMLYSVDAGPVWPVAGSATLFSAYGQLYNQLRDYDSDRAAGLRNTAHLLGYRRARSAMYAALVLAALCLLVAVSMGVFPGWLATVGAVGALMSARWRPGTDMRGSAVLETSGAMQGRALLVFNAMVAVWLIQVIASQIG